jgi:Protein of unknown function (DUF3604)
VPDKWTGAVPPIGSTVDTEKVTYTNDIRAVELKAVWTDPESAFCHIRQECCGERHGLEQKEGLLQIIEIGRHGRHLRLGQPVRNRLHDG